MKFSIASVIIGLGAIICLAVLLGRAIPARSAPPDPNTSSLGTISGRVTLDDGKPAVGYSVVARSARYFTPAPVGEAVTDADGRYRLVIDTTLSPTVFQSLRSAPGDTQFTVTVQGQEPLYLVPSEQAVTLPPSLTLHNVNFRLTKGPQITIRVHDAMTGQPVPGVTAKYLGNRAYSNDDKTVGVTDAQGQIVFRVPTLEVQLTLVPPGGNTPTIRPAPGYNLYREVSMPAAKDVVWDVETYPTTPPTTPSVWRGIVLDQKGQPADGAKVFVLRAGVEAATITDEHGHFVASLPPLTPEQYNDTFQGVAILAQKNDLSALLVPPFAAAWTEITVRLVRKPLASYAGTVVGPNGVPKAGVPVSCHGWLAVAPNSGASVNRFEVTDAQGHFRLAGLPAGLYQVNLGGGSFGPLTLPPSDPGYPYSNTRLTLRDGEQHDLGRHTVLPADEVLAGQIVDHDGKPVTTGIIAIVHGAHTNQMASLDDQGQFRTYHIVQEALTLDIYRSEANGGTSIGQDSPDLFLKVPVQAGREDVHVVLPAGILRLPVAAPLIAPALVGPPLVYASGGIDQIDGLGMQYGPATAVSDLQQAVIQVTLTGPKGTVWQGSMADMDGMQLIAKSNHGILKDRTDHVLWSGLVQEPPAYTVLTSAAKPHYMTLRDRQGRTLWSGSVVSQGSAVAFLDGYIAVVGPKGRIVWQQPAASGGVVYRFLDHGQAITGWGGSGPPPFDGVIHFAAAPHRSVFQTGDGHIIYSGNLLLLTVTLTGIRKSADAANDLFPMRRTIFPFSVNNFRGALTDTLYDAQGKTIQTSTWKQGT